MDTSLPVKLALTDEQRFQYLITGISDYAIYMLDPQGYVSSWNAGAQRFKGYLEHEILQQHFSRFYTPDDRATGLPLQALAQALEQGRYESEGWRVRKDGGRFWAHVVIDAIHDDTGTLIGFAKITRDVTEKKHAEDALRDSEQRFRLLVQGVTDYALYMLTPEGTVSNWNSGAERIKGYGHDEIVGHHFSRFYTDEDRLSGKPARALMTAGDVGRYEAEGWRVRKDGTRFWANVVIDAIRGEDGRLLGYAKITRDLTEKKAAAEALDKAQALLYQAQKMESIGQLTGGIAHDFNNLLSVISSGLEVLTMRHAGGGDAKTLDSMRRAIDRGANMTQQLLAFARQQPLEPETRSVNRIVSGFESVLRRAANSSIDFVLKLDPKTHNAVIDAARLESGVLNLVVNARDAMPGGGRIEVVTGNVTLSQDQVHGLAAGAWVRLAVSDTGSGMAPETIARAFEPFFTTKEIGKGTGLGLSQVYGFIKQSGGEVVIDSVLGQGTTIAIYLPAVTSNAAHFDDVETETVLIVEDEPDLLDVASSLFMSMGYDVMTAASGTDALGLLASRDVDILFTDVVMPNGMNGVELAAYTRQNYPNVKVMLASGYPQPALRLDRSKLGEFAFVSKPYRLSDLARSLRSAH